MDLMPRLLTLLLPIVATFAASLLLVRKALDWGFIDLPGTRKVHTLPTPRTGGLAMVVGGGSVFLLSLAQGWVPSPDLPWQTCVAGAGFITVGALDDRFSFHPRQKFLVFFVLSVLAMWPWIVILKTNGVTWLPQSWVASPLFLLAATVVITFWFMAVPNAVNIEDAINGYMGGFTFIIIATLALRGINTHIFLGALLGFLVLNWPNARHFMGDAGSFGCGFILAEALLRGGALENPSMAIIMTLPISADVAMGIVRRLRLGESLFSPDRSTCPHHLLARLKGLPLLASPMLWTLAALFAFTSSHPLAALLLALLYMALLLYFNLPNLRYPKQTLKS